MPRATNSVARNKRKKKILKSLLEQVKEELGDIAIVESEIRHEGRTMTMLMGPNRTH